MKTPPPPFLAFLAFCASAWGQAPPSPEVHGDGTVTFRLHDFGQHAVGLVLEGSRAPVAMRRNERGTWEATVGPLQPDYYGYSFDVDGVPLLDPDNSATKPSLLYLSSLLHVPGPPSLPWEDADIPHGEIHRHFYRSAAIGDNRDYYVYTPPGYDPGGGRRYPVLYLCHGYSDDASAWVRVGRANFILDHLIDSARARSMIVVMPLGYGVPAIVEPGSGMTLQDADARERNYRLFRSALVTEVIPRVEAEYRVAGDRQERALAGLSMGGDEALLVGLNEPGLFAWVGSFSAGAISTDFPSDFPSLARAEKRIRLLWIACGTDDPRIGLNRRLDAWLRRKGVPHVLVETPGSHAWQVWRRNLAAFVPLLFEAQAPAPPLKASGDPSRGP